MRKRLLLIIILIMLNVLAFPALAAGAGRLTMANSSGKQGDTVSIAVNLSSNPGLITMKFSISYDDDLELTSVSDSGLLKGWTTPSPIISSPYTIRWADSLSTTNNSATGKIVTLNFRIKDNASIGNKTITLHFSESRDATGGKNTFDDTSATITVTCKNHNFGSWSSNNTSTHKRTCSVCGYVETVNHTWNGGTVTKQATCKETGIRTFTCTACGATKTETIAKTDDHTYGNWTTTKAATCTATGTQERTCFVCGNKETKSIPATGHSYGGWVTTKEATCTAEGTETRTCSKCSAKETRSVKALGHNFSSPTITQQPTCTQPGEQTGTCTRCGQNTYQQIAPTGHRFDGWTTTVEATCTEKGKQERKCSSCGASETREVEALGHDFENPVVVKEATLSSTGLMEGKCKRCGETTQQVVPCQAQDEITGISVEAEEGVFSEGTTTDFVVVGENDASYASIQSTLQDYGSAFAAYEIGFNKDGAAVQPGGEYRLIFPNATGLTADNTAVYHIDEDGAAVKLEIMMDSDGVVSVQATESGLYALVDTSSAGSTNTSSASESETGSAPDTNSDASNAEVDTAPSNGPVLWIVLAVIAVVVIAGAVTAVILIKKRKVQ